MAFIDIFVDIFDGLDGCNGLHIDVAVIFPQKPWGIRDYPAVVNFSFRNSSTNFEFLSSVSSTEPGIRICIDNCLILEWLGKVFAALVIDNTGGVRIVVLISTWSVNHNRLDQFKELRLSFFIRKFCRDEAINILWSAELGIWMEKDNHVHVRKSTFLKFNSPDSSNSTTHNTLFVDVCKKLLHFGMKNTNNEIWTVSGNLAWEESFLDLWPVRVGSCSEKEISSMVVMIDCECILAVFCVLPEKEDGSIIHWPRSAVSTVGSAAMASAIP
jgi:hypothetical protein